MAELDVIPNKTETPVVDIGGHKSEEVHHGKKENGKKENGQPASLIKQELQIINLTNDMKEVKRTLSEYTKSIEGVKGEIRKLDNKLDSLKETFNAKFDSLTSDNTPLKDFITLAIAIETAILVILITAILK
jgi:archaellum component FlaC